MVRGALASLLDLEPDIEVVAQASRGDEVLAAAVGVHARRGSAGHRDAWVDRTRRGGRAPPSPPRLPHPDPDHVRPARLPAPRDGGRSAGFLLKDAPATELAAAIRRAVAGERVVDPGLAAAALSQGESPLTPREHEVLLASREHATVADLAGALYLSPGTVRNHLSSAMQKLDARNRAEAVRVAEEKGWL